MQLSFYTETAYLIAKYFHGELAHGEEKKEAALMNR